MKRSYIEQVLVLWFIFSAVMACKTTKTVSVSNPAVTETQIMVDPEKTRIDRFVTVEAVSGLQTGMEIDKAFSLLGSKPHNLISVQADGHHIYHYKYRLTNMEVPKDQSDRVGIEKRTNALFYTGAIQDLYLVFNGGGKLEYMVTTQGGLTEKLLRENNLLYVIKKDKDKFTNNPDSMYRNTNAAVFMPMKPCLDCDKVKNATLEIRTQENSSGSVNNETSRANKEAVTVNTKCAAIDALIQQLTEADGIVNEMIEADAIKKTQQRIYKLIPLERKYLEKKMNIDRAMKTIESNGELKNCPGLDDAKALKEKVTSNYSNRSGKSKK
jgi:hypothetical protein